MSILSGYLLKSQQSNLASSWSKRYVWLTPTTLEYAKSDKQSSKRTVLPLEALTVEAELVQTRRAHVISIKLDAAAAASVRDHEAPSGEEKATGSRTYEFGVAQAEVARQWHLEITFAVAGVVENRWLGTMHDLRSRHALHLGALDFPNRTGPSLFQRTCMFHATAPRTCAPWYLCMRSVPKQPAHLHPHSVTDADVCACCRSVSAFYRALHVPTTTMPRIRCRISRLDPRAPSP